MTKVADVERYFQELGPAELAADWDNVGLLVGDGARPVTRLLTCLTLTDAVVEEAVAERAEMVVTHHPLPFRPLRSVTTDTFDGRRVWRLASAGISVYSPHTVFDSARRGINERLAELLGLRDVGPLVANIAGESDIGIGRRGELPAAESLDAFARRAKAVLKAGDVAVVGAAQKSLRSVAVGCGSAGDLMKEAVAAGCNCFLTGEASFHRALEAEAAGIALVLVGHYASERFALELLADDLRAAFAGVEAWASRREQDPLRHV